ncbi:hypothetical protein NDU88_002887 [Pleurodeles waltl]|uniref:Uncharacterized protein n=1 Tax=Pleurodeles waltl TaxID=8319 RepID=A0AAV7T3S2_PLEWA|nr:hypothetical protein NDU88_002887 [Pleurodeles waltl]
MGAAELGLLTRPNAGSQTRTDTHPNTKGRGTQQEGQRPPSGTGATLGGQCRRAPTILRGPPRWHGGRSSQHVRTSECTRGSDQQDHLPRRQFVVWYD